MSIAGYIICRMVLGSSARIPSDHDEYRACEAAVTGLQHICDAEDEYESFIENYIEWETAINQLAVRQLVTWTIDDIQVQESRKLLAGKLANLLASARLYVYSLPKHAKAIFGDNLTARDEIKRAFSTQYDGHLAYRVLDALRNYAQHSALPIHGITTHAEWHRETEPHSMSFTVWPRIDPQQLAEDADFKRSVLNEMVTLEKVELKPMVRQYIESMSAVHKTFRTTTQDVADDWLAQLKRSTDRYSSKFPTDRTLALAVLPVDDRELRAGEPVYIDGPIGTYLKHMQSKYSAMMNFAKRRVDF